MIEVTTYIADDGKVFKGEYAKAECQAYERNKTIDFLENIKNEFNKIAKEISVPIAVWWYGDCAKAWKVTLKSEKDYQVLLDYLYTCGKVNNYNANKVMETPTNYPYTTIIGRGEEWAYEYKIETFEDDLYTMLKDIED